MLAIWVHSGDELKAYVIWDGNAIDHPVTHDLFDCADGVGCIRFVEEQNRDWNSKFLVALRTFDGLVNDGVNIIVRHSTVSLQDEEIFSSLVLSKQLTHELDEPSFTAARFSHDHHRDVASEPHVDGQHLHHVVRSQLVGLIRIVSDVFDAKNLADFFQLLFRRLVFKRLIKGDVVSDQPIVKMLRHYILHQNLISSFVRKI